LKKRYTYFDLFFAFISILFLFIIASIYFIEPDSYYISIFASLISIIFVVKFYDVVPLFILFLFISLYPLESIKYFWGDVNLSVYTSFQTRENVNFILFVNSLFVASLGIFIPRAVSAIKFDLSLLSVKSKKVFILVSIVCVLIIFFGIQGKSLLEGGKYGTIEKSPLHEYFLLFFMVAMFVQPMKGKLFSIIKYIIFFFYSIKTLLYGGRIEVLQLFLLASYFSYIIPGNFSLKYIYAGIFLSFYFAVVLNNFRTHPNLIFTGDFYSLVNPLTIFSETPDQKYLSSNQGDVLQSSARILGIIDSGMLTFQDRAMSFFYFIISSILPSSLLPDYVNLSSYRQDLYASGGGAIIGIYFFTWLGYIGPIVAGFFIASSINNFYFNNDIILKIYGFVLLYTFPRWYGYTPIFLVKFAIYSIVIYSVFFFIHKIFIAKE
jgi:hypothetical protein